MTRRSRAPSFRTSRSTSPWEKCRSVAQSFSRSVRSRRLGRRRSETGQPALTPDSFGLPDDRATGRPSYTPPYASQSVPRRDRRRGGRGLSWGRRCADGSCSGSRTRWPRARRRCTSSPSKFRELAEAATGGAVKVRLFPSGTLGQEREVVQQLQEGLVDFMVSGTAIWGSVAPRLQVFDFPFLWRDWAHVHGVVDGRVGREAADYLESHGADAAARLGRLVRLPPGHHPIARRHRAGSAGRPQDSDDPVADLREGGRADGREPDADGVRRGLHVAADRRHRRLRARREHDAAAALLRGRAATWRARGTSPACWGSWRRRPRSHGFPPSCAARSSRRRSRPRVISARWDRSRIDRRRSSSPGTA